MKLFADKIVRITAYSAGILSLLVSCGETVQESDGYPAEPLPLSEVSITGGFWAPILDTARMNTLPHILRFCEETGRIHNFAIAAGLSSGEHRGERYNDSDLFKAIEGSAYHLRNAEDKILESYIDSLIMLIAAAQEEDGYIYTPRTIDPETDVPGAGRKRWEDVWISHELYNAGHLYEAAVAYYEATGKRALLEVALKNAGLVKSVFNEDGLKLAPGHPEIEIGLVKLFNLTGDSVYLEQARFFLDQRGKEADREPVPAGTRFDIYNEPSYLQHHLPVREQKEAVGHAVRAMYLYSGMTDVGFYCSDTALMERTVDVWNDIVSSKMYITGGVGASHRGESFSDPYVLPNKTAYCETCAAAGNIFWNHRMFSRTTETKYLDVLETTLYNGLLSGVSLDGRRFFYPNPLESEGDYERSEWFGCACCPGNVARVIPSIPGYIYSKNDYTLFVNLFVESEATTSFYGKEFRIRQETNYPWDGKVRLTILNEKPVRIKIRIRIPGWWRSKGFLPGDLYPYTEYEWERTTVYVNGRKAKYGFTSFVELDKKWKNGDVIEFEFPIKPKLVKADERVEADRGKMALVRGPLVYAAEGIDNGGTVQNIMLSEEQPFTDEFSPSLLNGITVIRSAEFMAIPYYAWANRGPTDMRVWMPLKD
ncbi:MAG: glycoside hydrolase family 127 protein [Bacteroidales bacterium]|nr:glycoside hydrolase family 127 protein [Bacteroidales bacterium]